MTQRLRFGAGERGQGTFSLLIVIAVVAMAVILLHAEHITHHQSDLAAVAP